MGTAAQLLVKAVTDGDHADLGAVLLAEQRNGTGLASLVQAHDVGAYRQVLGQLVIDQGLNVAHLAGRQRRAVAEVKAQAGRRVLASGLVGMLVDHLAQARVDHVGRGVRPSDRQAAGGVDLSVGTLTQRDRALGQSTAVD